MNLKKLRIGGGMRRVLFLFMVLLAVSLLASCHKDKTPAITAKIVTDGLGINDKSYNANAWEGLLRFYGDSVGDEKGFGTLYDVAICNDTGRYVSDIKALSEQHSDLLILTSFTFAGALEHIAAMYPDQKYLTIDGIALSHENVMNYLFASEEGSYLVGALAALQAQAEGVRKARFGFIGGVAGDTITEFEVGFVQGIRSVLPDAEVRDFYVNDWSRPDLAAEQAKIWYDGGIYAVYSAAGMSGNGTIAEAVAHRKAGKNVWAIGVDKDQFGEGVYGVGKSAVLTSMIKHVDNAVEMGLQTVLAGSFKGGSRILTLKDGAVGYTTTNTELNALVVKQLAAIQADIVSGKITVTATYKDAAAADAIMRTVRHDTRNAE